MSQMTVPAGIWRHYKGGYYLVLGVAEDGETGQHAVIYVALTGAHLPGPRMRMQATSRFFGAVGVLGGPHVNRFEYVGLEVPNEDQPKFAPKQ